MNRNFAPMEGSVLRFFKAEWKVSDTGSAHWASSFCLILKDSVNFENYNVTVGAISGTRNPLRAPGFSFFLWKFMFPNMILFCTVELVCVSKNIKSSTYQVSNSLKGGTSFSESKHHYLWSFILLTSWCFHSTHWYILTLRCILTVSLSPPTLSSDLAKFLRLL